MIVRNRPIRVGPINQRLFSTRRFGFSIQNSRRELKHLGHLLDGDPTFSELAEHLEVEFDLEERHLASMGSRPDLLSRLVAVAVVSFARLSEWKR
jgi:hypothetical protein